MIRTIIWFTYFGIYLVLLIPPLIKAEYLLKKGLIKEHDEYVSKIAIRWSRSLLWVAGAKVNIEGLDNIPKGAACFISNHQGNFDIPIFLGYVGEPKGIIAKKELKNFPIISIWMKHINCVFIDRGNHRQGIESINEAVELLKKGYSVVVFPEGTRSKGDRLNEFKPGAFKIATKAQVPIVPVSIMGSYKLMESNKSIIKPGVVNVKIHPPIQTQGLPRDQQVLLHDTVKSIIAG